MKGIEHVTAGYEGVVKELRNEMKEMKTAVEGGNVKGGDWESKRSWWEYDK